MSNQDKRDAMKRTRENQRKRKAEIEALMADSGYSREAATRIVDGGAVVTIIDEDNVEEVKKKTKYPISKKHKLYVKRF